MKKQELLDKIAKMEAGLNNPNIADPQKEIMRKAIKNAKSQLEAIIIGSSKKETFLIENENNQFYTRSILGKSSWTDNINMAYTYNSDEIKSMISFVSREYPEMKVKEILISDAEKNLSEKKNVEKEKIKLKNKTIFKDLGAGDEIKVIRVQNENVVVNKNKGSKEYLMPKNYYNFLRLTSQEIKPSDIFIDPSKSQDIGMYGLKNHIKNLTDLGVSILNSHDEGEEFIREISWAEEKRTNKPTFTKYQGEEIMFVPAEGTYYVNDVEYSSMEAAKKAIDGNNKHEEIVSYKEELEKPITEEFFESILSDEKQLSSITKQFKKVLIDKNIFVGETLNEENLFVAVRAEKVMKLFCSNFSLNPEIVKDILKLNLSTYFATKVAEKFELRLVDLVVSNFMSNSQYLAMQKAELNPVKRKVYTTIMAMPIIGAGQSKYFLHYFTPSSDFYISEIDLGTNQQDFGFAILNGDLQMAERGYISIDEMIKAKKPAELDLYFDPISHKDLMEELEEKYAGKEKISSKEKYTTESEIEEILNDFIEMEHEEVLPEYRRLEENNEHTANLMLMAARVGNSTQINTAKKMYNEQIEKGFVDADLREKTNKLYYELHDEFREKYLKVDKPTISDEKINELINRTIAQVFIAYGTNTEIKSIDEVVSDNQIDVHFELIREIDGMRDITKKAEIHISFDGKILNDYTFKIPTDFDVNKFLKGLIDDLDKRSLNQITSYSAFLAKESESIVGSKIGVKTVKKLEPEKQQKLKQAYQDFVKKTPKTNNSETKSGKLKLTKRLKAHGVTQEMIDKINRTKEPIVLKVSKQATGKNTSSDRDFSAMKPGKRLSVNGTIYYEYRKDRTDKNPKNKI